MRESVVDGFDALGKLSGEAAWASYLQKKVADALAASGEKEPLLGKLYLDAERELVTRSHGAMSEDGVRAEAKRAFQPAAKDYPNLLLVFEPRERQFIELTNRLVGAFKQELRPVVGPELAENVINRSLVGTKWETVKPADGKGIQYSPLRFRSLQECAEMASLLFEGWYVRCRALLGETAGRRAFERAFIATDQRFGFLPAMKNVLGATPLEVLSMDKARRLHELETETSTQATTLRVADEGLRLQTERLQLTVAELEKTKQMLEVTSQARSAFIDVVSHQFRTPLSSMRWNAELLSDELGSKKDLDPAHKEAIENIRIKSVYLIETLDRVFTSLDIDTGALVLDKKPAFLWEIIQDVYRNYERDIAKKGLEWKFKRSKEQVAEIPLDKAKITTVLKIVIGNAINYNKDGGKITVDLKREKRNGFEYQVCSVSDEGVGIPPGDEARFFDKFYRSRPSILKVADGTGLGTYIVRHIIEAHKGFVEASSQGVDKGTTITIGLPLI